MGGASRKILWVFSQGIEVTKQKIACAVISCVEMQNDWDSLQVMVKWPDDA